MANCNFLVNGEPPGLKILMRALQKLLLKVHAIISACFGRQCSRWRILKSIVYKFCLTNVLKTNRLSTTKIYFRLNSSAFCIKSYSIQSKRNKYILHNYFDLKHKHVSFINTCCTLKWSHLLTAFYIFERQVETR